MKEGGEKGEGIDQASMTVHTVCDISRYPHCHFFVFPPFVSRLYPRPESSTGPCR